MSTLTEYLFCCLAPHLLTSNFNVGLLLIHGYWQLTKYVAKKEAKQM